MERFLTQEWELFLTGCSGTSALARGETFPARWLQEPQPISNHPVGLRCPHSAGRYRPGGSTFLSPGCWSRRDVEAFLTRGWERLLAGCGEISALARGATLPARWLHEPQPISNHSMGLGFPHPAGRYQPVASVLASPGSWSCRGMEGFLTRGDGKLTSRGALALCKIPSKSAIGQWDWGFHTVRGGFDPGDYRVRPQVVGVVTVPRDF